MELQFKTQDFQTDAADAICKIFEGQPYGGGEAAQYRVDPGADLKLFDETGYRNAPFQLTDDQILANLRSVQIAHNLQPSTKRAVNVPTAGKAGKRRGKAKAVRTRRTPKSGASRFFIRNTYAIGERGLRALKDDLENSQLARLQIEFEGRRIFQGQVFFDRFVEKIELFDALNFESRLDRRRSFDAVRFENFNARAEELVVNTRGASVCARVRVFFDDRFRFQNADAKVPNG